MWANFHTHSLFCDGVGVFEDYIQSAGQDMVSLGFSSHAPVPFDCKWCMKAGDFERYIDELETVQKSQRKIQIYKGLEADYVPGLVSPHTYQDRLDFTVGSIHFVDQLPNGRHWEIDNTHEVFLEGFSKIFKNNIRETIQRYYELTREMVSKFTPSIVGHLDKIKIQNKEDKFFRESDSWYQDEINKTLGVIAKTGAIVEVNTRGLYQKKSTTPYPSPWIIEKILEKRIPITISSDAHHPKDIVNYFKGTAQQLIQIGFKHIHILKDGKWRPVQLTPNGITT